MITNETKTATCELCGGTGLRGGAGEQKCDCGAVPPSPRLLDLLDQYWSIAYQQGAEGRTHDNEAGDAQRVISEITAALAPPAPLPVAVKALEWHQHDTWRTAGSVVGRYTVRPCLATNFAGQWLLSRDTVKIRLYPSEEQAISGGQADYETRIRSALSSPVGGMEEPMAIIERCAAIADDAAADFERQAHLEENAIRHDSLFLVADGCELVAEAIRELKGSSASPTPASDIAALREALERIAEASPRSTNSWSAEEAFSWCAAVAETALDSSALQHVAKGERG